MPQNFFQFKQFRIEQGDCAMKVSTDGCFFGAAVEADLSRRILDIGTGTGLLALMLTQRSEAKITALEIDECSFRQAKHNFEQSPWRERLKILHTSVQDFAKDFEGKFDLIVCNPPFFKNHLQPQQRNPALHNETLNLEDLLEAVLQLLDWKGKFWLMLPPYESRVFEKLAVPRQLFKQKTTFLHTKTDGKILREITVYAFQNLYHKSTDVFIRKQDGAYTETFEEMLTPYYLQP
jgi:tRNA1Val (adenine37-N6)-methyltransferase